MPSRKAVVETYFEGFRHRDHGRILACLTDDIVWDLPGHAHLVGKDAFKREMERPTSADGPILIVNRLVEEADTVVAIGNGEGSRVSGERFRFAFCTVCTFAGDKICRVDSYTVPLEGDD